MFSDESILNNNNIIYGIQINEYTGCHHYSTPLDVVAIKFKCCQHYYACYSCHLALTHHKPELWQSHEFHNYAVLCGCCGAEMTIYQYMHCGNNCLNCKAQFNEKCKLHWHLYFDL